MRLNCKKTKILTVSKNDEAQYHQFRANNESLETADCSAFLADFLGYVASGATFVIYSG